MNAVIDEDLHRSLKPILESLGFVVFDVRDHGLRGKSDNSILNFAQNKQAVLFTGDLDFSNILVFPPGTHCGIVILRFPNILSTTVVNHQLLTLLPKLQPGDYQGNIVIVSPDQIRLRGKSGIN